MENAGLSEIFENVFLTLPHSVKEKLLKFVLLTGGHTKVSGFDKRIEAELRMLNRVGTPLSVVKAYDP